MSCKHTNCNREINYCVSTLNNDEDFSTLRASSGIYTSKIYDSCDNLRIDLGCADCNDDGNCSDLDCGDIVRSCDGEEIEVVALFEKSTGNTLPFVGCSQINAIKKSGNGACWQVVDINGKRYNLNSISCCKKICAGYPIVMEGDLQVNGNIYADEIHANEFYGNGCNITNTDNNEITQFYHDIEHDLLVIKTENTKDCEDIGDTSKLFVVNTKPFTLDTKICSVEFEDENGNIDEDSDILVIRECGDGGTFEIDFEKYNNKQETYIADGNCTPDGIISLDYNPTSPLYPQQVIVDISDAIQTLDSAEYDPCKGEMMLCHKNGMCLVMDNLPINFESFGEVPLRPEWSGNVYYHIRSNVIMVSVNVELSQFTQFPPGNFMPVELGRLPVKLKDYRHDDDLAVDTYTYKYLVSHSAKSMGFINHVQLGVSLDGIMRITQWQVPERIQDSFCLVIESINKSETAIMCPEPPVPIRTKVRYISNNNANEIIEVDVIGDRYQIQPNTFTYNHWDFLLWNTMPDRSGDSFKPNYWIKVDGTDVDLYAQWKQVIFVVTYDGNNGTGEIRQFEFYPGVAVLGNMFERPLNTTYSFAEWNTEFDGTGTPYQPKDLLYVRQDITLYAIWR